LLGARIAVGVSGGKHDSPLSFEVRLELVPVSGHYVVKQEDDMKKILATCTLGLMMAMPLMTMAASSAREGLPPAVDQLLAQDLVQQAQANLKIAGYDPGRVDGIFDERTAEAVRRFQVARSLPVSGLLDEQTRRVLLPGLDNAGDGEG
jgi:N-acetyl-anhydromuramyl-L-alanine amidase AmpD